MAEGRTPAIVADSLHEIDAYALKFGWESFWKLDDASRARVVATMQVEQEIEFVSNFWGTYGESSQAAVNETPELPPDQDPFAGWGYDRPAPQE